MTNEISAIQVQSSASSVQADVFTDELLKAIDEAGNKDGIIHYGFNSPDDMKNTETYKYYARSINEFTKGGDAIKAGQRDEFAKKYHIEKLAAYLDPSRDWSAAELTNLTAAMLQTVDEAILDTQEGNRAYNEHEMELKAGSTDVPILDYLIDNQLSVHEEKTVLGIGDWQSEQSQQAIKFAHLSSIMGFFETHNLKNHPDYLRLKPQYDAMKKEIDGKKK